MTTALSIGRVHARSRPGRRALNAAVVRRAGARRPVPACSQRCSQAGGIRWRAVGRRPAFFAATAGNVEVRGGRWGGAGERKLPSREGSGFESRRGHRDFACYDWENAACSQPPCAVHLGRCSQWQNGGIGAAPCAGSAGVRAHHRSVDHHGLQVWIARHRREESLPHAQIRPAREALVDAIPHPVLGWQESPLRPTPVDPVDRLQELPLPRPLLRMDLRFSPQHIVHTPESLVAQEQPHASTPSPRSSSRRQRAPKETGQ
jgi:hypothetical protein